jgi:hypothetical protein
MEIVARLRVRDRETRDFIRHVGTGHTIQVVDTLASHFKNIGTNAESGTGNVGELAYLLCADVDVEHQTGFKIRAVEQNETTLARRGSRSAPQAAS